MDSGVADQAPETSVKQEPGDNEAEQKPEVVPATVKDEHVSDEEEDPLESAETDTKEARIQLISDPAFAEVQSFFNSFGTMMNMKPMTFEKLEQNFLSNEVDGSINHDLIELHLSLMRRVRYTGVRADNFEKFLSKFCQNIDSLESEHLQLTRYGYANLSVSSRLAILVALCVAQFEYNTKLRELMTTTFKAHDLHLIPLGIDKNGLAYRYQQDSKLNVRIYTEELEDRSGITWSLVVETPEQLEELTERLKNEDLGYKKKEVEKEKNKLKTHDDAGNLIVWLKNKGTFVDRFLDDHAIKAKKQLRQTEKEDRRRKREGATEKPKYDETEEEEEEEEQEAQEEEKPEEDTGLRRRPVRAAALNTMNRMSKIIKQQKPKTVKAEKAPEPEEEEDEEEDEEPEGSDEDDEFKVSTKGKGTGIKRKRKPKPDAASDSESDEEEEVVKERKVATQDSNCKKCVKSDRWEVLLLCDNCDDAWHTDCLKPPLWYVPDGDWFCPKCLHGMLVERLELVNAERQKALAAMKLDAKKQTEQDRMRREMEYIGLSVNLLPVVTANSSSDEDVEENPNLRKSKRRAIKKISAPRIRSNFDRAVLATIREGRTRRSVPKIDYSFKEYENMIKEAVEVDNIDKDEEGEADPSDSRPTGGRGEKDMSTIMKAEAKEEGEDGEDNAEGSNDGEPESRVGRPAVSAKQKKGKKRLNDLDSDQEASEGSEYQESENSEVEENDLASGSDYVPSDMEGTRRRRSARQKARGPTRSDEEFVVSESDGSDLGYRGRREKEKKKRRKRGKIYDSLSEEQEDSEWSDDSTKKKKQKLAKKGKADRSSRSKRGRYDSAEESEEEEEEEEQSENSEVERTKTGRKMRKAAAQATKKAKVIEEEEDEDEEQNSDEPEEEAPKKAAKDRKKKTQSDDEFTPEEEEEDADEDDEEEDEAQADEEKEDDGSEDSNEPPAKKQKPETSKPVSDNQRRAPPPKAGLNKPTAVAARTLVKEEPEEDKQEEEQPKEKTKAKPSPSKKTPTKVVKEEPAKTPTPPPAKPVETKPIVVKTEKSATPPKSAAPPSKPGALPQNPYGPPGGHHPSMAPPPYYNEQRQPYPPQMGMSTYSQYSGPPPPGYYPPPGGQSPYLPYGPPSTTYSAMPQQSSPYAPQGQPPQTSPPVQAISTAPPATDEASLGGALASAMGNEF